MDSLLLHGNSGGGNYMLLFSPFDKTTQTINMGRKIHAQAQPYPQGRV